MATRTERVVLELQSNISTQVAKDAAAVALLKRELGGLDGSTKQSTSSTKAFGDQTERTSKSTKNGSAEIDKFSGRLAVLGQVAAALGPALVPIGAVAVPAAAGLAGELAAVALGAGTAMIAFHGLGGALGALNKAALNPTVTNLNAAQIALDGLPPAAREFARELSAMQPTIERLRQSAASGLFPGLEDALNQLSVRSHDVEKILYRVGLVLGDLARKGADALAGPKWDSFFKFISVEAPRALEGLGRATGDVVHGLAQLWMAFAPLNRDFTNSIVAAADGFDRWATGLSKTQGFSNFIDYLRANGPLVADAVVAIGNAVLKIVEAAAPMGGVVLQSLTAVAKVISTIADSSAGPTILATVSALAILGRAQATFGKISSASWVQAVKGAEGYSAKVSAARPALIKGGLAAAGLAVAASGVADKFGLANTATLALTGSIAGPWGAAAGGAVGLLLDMTRNSSSFNISTQDLTDTLNQQTGAITQNTRAYVSKQLLDQGILQDAKDLGLNLADVTRAALGNEGAMRRVDAAMAALGYGSVETGDKIKAVNDALLATSDATGSAQGNLGLLNDALLGTPGHFDNATTAADRFRHSIDQVNAILQHRSSLRDYQQALDDFASRAQQRAVLLGQVAQAQNELANATTASARQSARDRIATLTQQANALKNSLDINTQAGRDTQASIDRIAQAAIAAAQTMKGVAQTKFLSGARRDFIEATAALKGSKKAAGELADKLGLIDRTTKKHKIELQFNEAVGGVQKVQSGIDQVAATAKKSKPKIDLQYDEALGGIKRVLQALNRLPSSKTITVNTVSGTAPSGGRPQLGFAGGGTVPGPRQPYGDKVLIMAAPGEEIITNRNGEADAYRAAMNAQRYADGGTVARSRTNVYSSNTYNAGSSIDYGRLAGAMSAVRPLYGDVKITGDPSTFKRQMQQDRALSEMSGVRRG